jgi:NAD(P)H-flavin reductase
MATEWREQDVELRQVISQPNGDWSGPTGYVQSLLEHIVPELKAPVALVCGSNEMIEQTRLQLLDLGFAPEKILTNY